MGIYIRLESPLRITPIGKALARLHYCDEIINFFYRGRNFIPRNVTIWLKATSETLGGTLENELDMHDPYRTFQILREMISTKFYTEELFSSIIVFNGIWNFDGLKLEGFISANNEYAWNRAYYDVEVDAYGNDEFEDLVDVFWEKEMLDWLVPGFISQLERASRRQRAKPREIYFSIGAPERGEVSNLIAIHLPDWHDVIDFFYARLRRDKASWIKNKVAPLDRYFFVSSIREQKIVHSIFKQIAKETSLIEKSGGSVIYIAKERDSFSKFYQKFKEAVFKPASQELPQADHIKKIIQKGLEKTKSLDQLR